MLKGCSKCRLEKHVSKFSKNKSTKDGLSTWCKSCKSAGKKKYYQANKNLILEKAKDYSKLYYSRSKLDPHIRELIKRKEKKRRDGLSKSYLKGQLQAKGWDRDKLDKYPDIIEIQKFKIKIKRLVNGKVNKSVR
jgi:hypothetical protein